MNTYKITNITNQLHKRDVHFKTPVKIQYIDNRIKKTVEVKTGESLFLTVESLPLAIHRLRIKGLINVNEASVAEVKKMNAPNSPKKVSQKPKTEKPKTKSTSSGSGTTNKKSSGTKKRSYSKSTTSKSSSTGSKADTIEKETTS